MIRNVENTSSTDNAADIEVIANNSNTLAGLSSTINSNLAKLLASNKPVFDGCGLKSINSDNSRGINFDGKNFYAVENLGSTKKVYLNSPKTVVPLLTGGQFINLPTTASPLKVSSDSALDIGQILFILGYDVNFNQIFDTFTLNGVTPVLGAYGASFFRILGGQMIFSNGRNTPGNVTSGNMYVVQSTYTNFTLGIPADLTVCMATANNGTGNIYTGSITIPPGSDLYLSEMIMSSNQSGKSSDLSVTFYSRMGTASGWRALAQLDVNAAQPSLTLHQSGFPSLNTDSSGTLYHDLQLVCNRTSGTAGADDVTLSTFLTGIQVKTI